MVWPALASAFVHNVYVYFFYCMFGYTLQKMFSFYVMQYPLRNVKMTHILRVIDTQ